MFGISISYADVQTIFQTFWQTSGYVAMLGVVMASGIVVLLVTALRSGLFGVTK